MPRSIKKRHKTYTGRRILAGLIDYTVMFIVWFLMISISDCNKEGLKQFSVVFSWIYIAFWFFWNVALEQVLGATVGNKLLGLRPVPMKDPEGKLTWKQSFARHLLDTIDMFFGIFVIILIKSSQRSQRFGDFLAHTEVILAEDLRKKPSEPSLDRPISYE